jgi:hypothetical protein
MKSKIIFIVVLFAIVSCSTKEHKAQDSIKEYLQGSVKHILPGNLYEPTSYESIEFGKLKGGPDIYSMTHKYKEKLEIGEIVLQYDTFVLNQSCLHAISVKHHKSDMDDLEWAIKWNNMENQ